MKIVTLLFCSLIFSVLSHSQTSITAGPLKYDTVLKSQASRSVLFSRAKSWIVDNFKSSKNVIQSEDKEEGVIVCHGNLSYSYKAYLVKKKSVVEDGAPWTDRVLFTLKFYGKDEKARVIFSDIIMIDASGLEVLNLPVDYALYGIYNKQMLSDKPSEIATGKTGLSKLEAIREGLSSMIDSLLKSLSEKGEGEF